MQPIEKPSEVSQCVPAKVLFEGNFMESLQYGVAADDQRLAMVHSGEKEGTPRQLNEVVNWVDELKRRLPGGKN